MSSPSGDAAPVYLAYGLRISSALELPELPTESGQADITIRYGDVPRHLDQPLKVGVLFEANAGCFLLHVTDIASYLARGGNEITVAPVSGADPRDIRTFLLSAVFNAVLHQRGLLAMHAGAVAGSRGTLLIAGTSGSGKSTLLAALSARGHHVVADDLVGVDAHDDGRVSVTPGYPQLRLWHDALQRLGLDPDAHQPIRGGLAKFAFRLRPWTGELPPVSALCVLRLWNEDRVELQEPSDSDRFAIIRAQTRMSRVMEGAGMQPRHFQLATALAARVPMVRLFRPRVGDSLAEVVTCVERRFLQP